MSVTLGVETSSHAYGVVVLADDAAPTRLAELTVDRREPGFVDVGQVVAAALEQAGRPVADVGRIAVDVGPGNLASVRAGIAYVNALAYARDVPVVAVDSLTVLGTGVLAAGWPAPVLALRPGGGPAVYGGRLDADGTLTTRHGDVEDVVAELTDGLTTVSLCGPARARGLSLVGDARDTGIDLPTVGALAACLAAGAHAAPAPSVSPLTELSPAFAS